MSGARKAAGAVIAVACLLVTGCGSKPAPSASRPKPPAPPPLATSFASADGASWTVVQMGGSASQENNFWQVFLRPATTAAWHQVTPLGVADNGGLVVASSGSGSLVTAFRPSQLLTYTPLAASTDNGTKWSSAGPLNAGLASAPDALAAGSSGQLIALTSGGTKAELGQRLGTTWARLATMSSLNATSAGKACEVTGLTAAAFSGGTPMLAGSCGRPGVAGIFAETDGTWHAGGLAVPSWMAATNVDVLRLAADGSGMVALLQAGTGASASIVAAWYDAGRWTVSAPLRYATNSTAVGSSGSGGGWGGSDVSQSTVSAPLQIGNLRSTAIGPGGSIGIILGASHGETLAGPGAAWHALPTLPKSTATLVLGTTGQVDAIAASGGTFRDWRLGTAGWSLAQTVHVQIPYGSSS